MKQLTSNFNGIDVLGGRGVRRCPACGLAYDKWELPLECSPKPGIAFSVSRDGFCMVSARFREVCESNGIFGCTFVPISNGYYALRPERIIRIEQKRLEERLCPECNRYWRELMRSPPTWPMTKPLLHHWK